MKITEKDLIGDIKDFPIEVVQRMVECQVEQGIEPNIKIFQEDRKLGFSWVLTKEDYSFWSSILKNKDFDLFFRGYPKKETKPYPKVMLVWDEEDTIEDACKRVVFMEKNKRFVAWSAAETIEDSELVTDAKGWDFAQDIPEIELPENVKIKQDRTGIEVCQGQELSIENLKEILKYLET